MKRWPNTWLMLGQHRRQWANIKATLDKRRVCWEVTCTQLQYQKQTVIIVDLLGIITMPSVDGNVFIIPPSATLWPNIDGHWPNIGPTSYASGRCASAKITHMSQILVQRLTGAGTALKTVARCWSDARPSPRSGRGVPHAYPICRDRIPLYDRDTPHSW